MFCVRVYIKSFDYYLSNKIFFTLKKFLIINKIRYKGPIYIPNKIEKFNILRSPHVNKDSRDQLQIITHKRFIDIYNISLNYFLKIEKIFIYYNYDFYFKILKFFNKKLKIKLNE